MGQDFEGKVVLLTGAGSGLGRATALKLAAAGATLALVDLNGHGLAETVQLAASSTIPLTIESRLGDRASCAAVVDQVVAKFGRLDVLLNVAGAFQFHTVGEVDQDSWDMLVASNISAPFFMIQAAMPHLVKSSGNIVNIASAAAFLGQAYSAPYAATKAALVSLTKSLAVEFAHLPVRINAVAPGGMNTPIIASAFPEGADETLIYRYAGLRGVSEPEDVAEVILFVASDRARAVHGTCYLADRGITAG